MNTLGRVELPFKLLKRGKVRDVFEVDGRLLIVSSDRISAFDYILPSLIPGKGQVLNLIAAFWFEKTKNLVANHVLHASPENLAEFKVHFGVLDKRALLARKLSPLPLEAIIRSYVVGLGWKSYQQSGEICGIKLPSGLKFAERLPEPIFTPTTKAESGHDENMSFGKLVDLLGRETAERIQALSLQLFAAASEYAISKGIIIADSKFEFGRDEQGNIVLMDEIFTPDSSRFWKLDDYRSGQEPPSYDKQLVRNYLLSSTWDRKSIPPELPEEVIIKTRDTYQEIYRILTGKNP